MILFNILIFTYLTIFVFIFLHTFIVRYFPVKMVFPLLVLVRISVILILIISMIIMWTDLIPSFILRIITGIVIILFFIININSLLKNKISIVEKGIISLPYYASMFFGSFIIRLKYMSFYPYASKVICPSCYGLNKPKDSREYETDNYRKSYFVKTEIEVFNFNRENPLYKNNCGNLRFGIKMRFCHYCGHDLMKDGPYFHLVCILGNPVNEVWGETTYVVLNPAIEKQTNPIFLSALYIDPVSTDPQKLEQFITFLINNPGKGKPEDLPVYYYGELDTLGNHMKNLLHNTFKKVLKKGELYDH